MYLLYFVPFSPMNTENIVPKFLRIDDTTLVNYNYIQWFVKHEDCFEVCAKPGGCIKYLQTSYVCKNTEAAAYKVLLKLFNEHK